MYNNVQYLQVIITRRYIISFARSFFSRFSIPLCLIIASPPLPPRRLSPLIGCPGWAPPTRLRPSWVSLWWLTLTPYTHYLCSRTVLAGSVYRLLHNRSEPVRLVLSFTFLFLFHVILLYRTLQWPTVCWTVSNASVYRPDMIIVARKKVGWLRLHFYYVTTYFAAAGNTWSCLGLVATTRR